MKEKLCVCTGPARPPGHTNIYPNPHHMALTRLIHDLRRSRQGVRDRHNFDVPPVHMNDPPCASHARAALRFVLRRSSCSTCVGAIAARAHRAAFAHGIDRDRSGAFLHVPRGHSCISVGSTHASPFVSLTTLGFPAVARRQPIRLLPLSTPGRALLPRDCPILRP